MRALSLDHTLLLMKPARLRADLLAGLTSSFALVPECIAFALVAQVNPLMGLYGAFIICTLTALFGGRPGMISGAAGSMAVVIVALVVQHGVQYLLATVLLGGLIMLAFGLLRLGKLIRMVPHPVMLGFVNGLAIIIALAQFEHFQHDGQWLQGQALYLMLGLVALTMLHRLPAAAPDPRGASSAGGDSWHRCAGLSAGSAHTHPGRHGADRRRPAEPDVAGHSLEPGHPRHHRPLRHPDGPGRPAGNPADPEPHRRDHRHARPPGS